MFGNFYNLESKVRFSVVGATMLKQFVYSYDSAGNRTSEEIQTGTNAPTAISQSSYNNVNQLASRSSSGGPMRFKGSLNETGTVMVAGSPATMKAYTNFTGSANVSLGTNVVQIIASDYSGHSNTNKFQVIVTNNGVAETISFDLNGNETSVVSATSTNSYQWDAANRLVSITGQTNQSLFTYDGLGRRVQITELQNGVTVSTSKFVWCRMELCEQRDSTGATVTKRFFGEGEQISGVNYFFTRDHLGSVREMTDASGTIQARYDYDPYGRRTKISGSLDADFAFTGDYYHAASGLYLTLYRAYDSDLGRWLSRDSLREKAGLNLYDYVGNNTINAVDPLGLDALDDVTDAGIGLLAIAFAPEELATVAAIGLGLAVWSIGGDIGNAINGGNGPTGPVEDVAYLVSGGNPNWQTAGQAGDLLTQLLTGTGDGFFDFIGAARSDESALSAAMNAADAAGLFGNGSLNFLIWAFTPWGHDCAAGQNSNNIWDYISQLNMIEGLP